jgi:hypothetical protein
MTRPVDPAQRQAVEEIERDAWESLCRAAPPAVVRDIGLEISRLDESLLTLCGRVDQGQFNRLFCLGLCPSSDAKHIAEAIARFRVAGLRTPFIQIPPGNPDLEEAARAAGLAPRQRPWVKFLFTMAKSEPSALTVEVTPVAPKQAELFGALIAAGFGMPPIFGNWLSAIVGREGWHPYLAWDGTSAIGGAAFYMRGKAAWLGMGATRRDARRRGAQSALLARRVRDATAMGATLITTETGKPLPDEDHPSYRNIIRCGFVPAYERTNWSFSGLAGGAPRAI